MTAKVTPQMKQKPKDKVEKPKEKKKKKGRYKLKLKGWLKTPADWAAFDAWAKKNAQPRKILEPEPIIRISKPLWKMKKRIDTLSKPVPKPDLTKMYRFDLSVPKKALKAKASRRIKEIAKPVFKPVIEPREFPVKIKKSTLTYQATQQIIDISRPKDYRTEECRNVAEDLKKLKSKMDEMSDEAREKEKSRLWAITKKALACPGLLSSQQIQELITDAGVYRTALVYEFTPWMQLLSLPAYRILKNRNDDIAEKWKEEILSEMETRGKRALQERIEKEEKRRKLQEKSVADNKNEIYAKTVNDKLENENKENDNNENIENIDDKSEETDREDIISSEEQEGDEGEEKPEQDEQQSEESEKKTVTEEPEAGAEDKQIEEKAKEVTDKKPKKVKKKRPKTPTPVDEETAKKRRVEKNAWRFEPPPWKDGDPLAIKESALKGPVSPRMAELAKPHIHKDTISRKNPFDVKKSALTSPISARMTELAKPTNPRNPVERPKPRKRNKYGKPIFPMPPYGKKLPPRKPYKERECKTDEKTSEEPEVVEKIKEPIDPIAFKPTIDPYFDPEGAQLQLKARNAFKKKEEVNTE